MNCLREVRKKLGVSKWKLARQSGLNWKTIHRIEMGLHIPFEKSKERIAKALGVSVEEVFPVREVSHIFLVEPKSVEMKEKTGEDKEIQVVGYLLDRHLRRCAGVGVRLMDGKRSLSRTISEEDGKFSFKQVPEGIYQVVSKSAKQEIRV
jgi:DNA-binding XRE family transcriptional regulator